MKQEDTDINHNTLKERCKRIRYVEPLIKFENEYQNYKTFLKEYKLEEELKKENDILLEGYKKIYTDVKTDYVYRNSIDENMYFQIQDVQDDCLIIAYDNKNYYEFDEEKQRKLLLDDVSKLGVEIIDEKNIDRFKLIGKTLTIKEIIDIMNETIMKLYS